MVAFVSSPFPIKIKSRCRAGISPVPMARCRAGILAFILCVALIGVAAQEDRDPKPPGYLDPLVAKYKRALETHRGGDPRHALVQYYKLLRNPDDVARLSPQALAALHSNVGSIHYDAGAPQAAVVHFREALKSDPEHPEARVNLALILSEDFEEHDEALTHGRKAIELRPEHAKSYHLLGNILQKLGQDAEAHLRFKTAETLASGKTASMGNPLKLWRWNATELGEITHVPMGDEAEVIMETISLVPPVFRVRDFLTPDERKRIIELATPELRDSHVVSMEGSKTSKNASSSHSPPPRKSSTAWLVADTDETGVLESIRRRAMRLMVLPDTVRSERLQVLRYEAGGYFSVHHESTAFIRRYATLLYYLDGPGDGNGGETVFPLGPDGDGGLSAGELESMDTISGGDVRRACEVGVRAAPVAGDAILFYNFGSDGEVDPSAIHAACEVTGGVKWAANHWFNLPEEDSKKEMRDEL